MITSRPSLEPSACHRRSPRPCLALPLGAACSAIERYVSPVKFSARLRWAVSLNDLACSGGTGSSRAQSRPSVDEPSGQSRTRHTSWAEPSVRRPAQTLVIAPTLPVPPEWEVLIVWSDGLDRHGSLSQTWLPSRSCASTIRQSCSLPTSCRGSSAVAFGPMTGDEMLAASRLRVDSRRPKISSGKWVRSVVGNLLAAVTVGSTSAWPPVDVILVDVSTDRTLASGTRVVTKRQRSCPC